MYEVRKAMIRTISCSPFSPLHRTYLTTAFHCLMYYLKLRERSSHHDLHIDYQNATELQKVASRATMSRIQVLLTDCTVAYLRVGVEAQGKSPTPCMTRTTNHNSISSLHTSCDFVLSQPPCCITSLAFCIYLAARGAAIYITSSSQPQLGGLLISCRQTHLPILNISISSIDHSTTRQNINRPHIPAFLSILPNQQGQYLIRSPSRRPYPHDNSNIPHNPTLLTCHTIHRFTNKEHS